MCIRDSINADGTATTDSSSLDTWYDKSGNNNNATQSTDDNKPTFLDNGLNNYTSVEFDGSEDFFNLPDGTVPYDDTPYSVFIVSQLDDATSNHGFLAGGTYSNDDVNAFRTGTNGNVQNYWLSLIHISEPTRPY